VWTAASVIQSTLIHICVTEHWVNMQLRLTNSQPYTVNAIPGTNHSTNPTNPNGNSKR